MTGFTLSPAPFPYLDPVKDAMALKALVQMGVVSPQQLIRDRNQNPETVKAEQRDWAEHQASLLQDFGVMPGPLEGQELVVNTLLSDGDDDGVDARLSDNRQ